MVDTRTRLLAIVRGKMADKEIAPSISALCVEAGISRSTIYKYYPEVVVAVKRITSEFTADGAANSSIKMNLLRRRVSLQKSTIEHLTNICSNQLVEIFELKQSYEILSMESSARVNYLESQLALAKRSNLKSVK